MRLQSTVSPAENKWPGKHLCKDTRHKKKDQLSKLWPVVKEYYQLESVTFPKEYEMVHESSRHLPAGQ